MFDELNNEIVQLMLDLSREDIGNVFTIKSRIEKIDLKELYNLCVQHEMDGVVASNIIKNDVCVLPEYWIKKYENEKKHLKFLKNKACEICEKMAENGIKMVILKNGGIMCDMISDEAACPMEDIDSLVKKSDFLKAHDILIENGLSFKFRSEYEKEEILELNNYKLHIIHTKRYKTINMSIVFTNEIKKQNITYSNILMDYLNSTNQLYKEKRDIFIKLEDLYNMLNSYSSFRLGNYLITKLEYEFLNPKYTEETMYEETIQFIKDLIFKPDFTNEEIFKRIKLDIQSELDTIKEDPSFYANLKYNEYFGKDTNISLIISRKNMEILLTENYFCYVLSQTI